MRLINVLKVEDITDVPKVEREIMLMKIGITPETKTEILEVVDIFRAKVCEISDETMTLEITGDPGKTVAFQKVLQHHPILTVARTGRVALMRDSNVDTEFIRRHGIAVELFDPVSLGIAPLTAPSLVAKPTRDRLHTISILVEDVPGILVRVTGLFSRRGYGIESLAVGPAERKGLSRISVVVPGDDPTINLMNAQLERLINVIAVEDITDVPTVQRELMLIKVTAEPKTRTDILQIAKVFRAKILDVGEGSLTMEVTGDPGKMAAIQQLLRKFGIMEIARTGKIAIVRESKVNTNVVTSGVQSIV